MTAGSAGAPTTGPAASPAAGPRDAGAGAGAGVSRSGRPRHARSTVVVRARAALCCLALTAAVFAQQPGELVGDTKLDLTQDPVRFLSGALNLWDPRVAFGELQNQAYGYLFPMGPFFALGHGMGLPGWAVQRAWQSLVLVVAFLGLRALAGRMRLGTENTRLLGALAFALSPYLLSKIGPISIEAWPEAVSPWVLLPLVGADSRGSPRRAALLSGVALLCVGGVNAAATAAVLPLPALWILTRPRGAFRRRLAAWWVVAVALACAWWAGPLLLLGHYSPPFLDWIESSATTTAPTGLLASLTGSSDWLGYLTSPDGPTWRAGWLLVTHGLALLEAAVLVAGGVLGLARRDMPHRTVLIGGLLLGLLAVTAGHAGPLPPLLHGRERQLLDTSLAALRNVHKYDVVLRIPLALGLVHACARVHLPVADPGPVPGAVRDAVRTAVQQVAAAPVALVAALALAAVCLPIWAGQLEPAGEFTALPTWWTQAAAWLNTHSGDTRSLLVPASPHGQYLWGQPQDEPLQVLATSPWAVRDAVPLGGAGEARMLDAIEGQLAAGTASLGLAPYLARDGVRYVVVRNDLDQQAQQVTAPLLVNAALADSPGLTQVASFGPQLPTPPVSPGVLDEGLTPSYPAVEIYQVDAPVTVADTQPVSTTVRVSGGPESVLDLLGDGVLSPGQATVLAGSPVVAGEQPAAQSEVVTDGYRRQEVDFGRAADNISATLSAAQRFTVPRAVHDYLPVPAAGHQTVAVIDGARSITASSSASDAAAFWLFDPADTAEAGFDADPSVHWTSGGVSAVGQWLQEQLTSAQDVSTLDITALASGGVGPAASEVRVTTEAGTRVDTLAATSSPQPVPAVAGATTFVRVTVLAVSGGGPGYAVALKVAVPGVAPPARSLKVAPDSAVSTGAAPFAGQPTFAFTAEPGANSGCVRAPSGQVCSPALVAATEDATGLDRTFTLGAAGSYTVRAAGRPLAGMDTLLPTAGGVRITASSQLVDDVADAPQTLLESVPGTGWIARPGDRTPTLTLTLPRAETLTALRLTTDPTLPADKPTEVTVHAVGRAQTVRLSLSGVAVLPRAVVTRRVQLTFPALALREDFLPAGVGLLPVGISQITLYDGVSTPTPPGLDTPVRLPCGTTPDLVVDGQPEATSATMPLGTALTDGEVPLSLCTPGSATTLAAGTDRTVLDANSVLLPDSLVLTPRSAAATTPPAARTVTVRHWAADSRTVTVGAGAASWLVVHENANPGWQAVLDGHPLASAVIDGWQQGYLVPAGAGGSVTLTFRPDHLYRLSLLVGALAAALLVLGAAVSVRRRSLPVPVNPAPDRRWHRPAAALLGAGAVVLLGGVAGVAALGVAAGLRLALRRWAPAGAPAGGVLAAGCVVAAGVVSALRPYGSAATYGAISAPAQALCLLALALLAAELAAAPESPPGTATETPAPR